MVSVATTDSIATFLYAIAVNTGAGIGGGAMTVADGSDVAEGAKADATYTDVTGVATGSLIALSRGTFVLNAAMSAKLPASLGIKTAAASLSIAPASDAVFATAGPVANLSTASPNFFPISARYLTTPPTYTNTQIGELGMSSNGGLRISMGARNTAGDNVSNSTTVGVSAVDGVECLLKNSPYIFNGTTWDRVVKSNAASRLLSSAATTNATSVKATAGNLFKIFGNNTVASKRYLKFYNKTSVPTVGADTPVLTFVLAASASFAIDIGDAVGHFFSAGIAYAITGAAADADTTAIAAGDIECLNLTYA